MTRKGAGAMAKTPAKRGKYSDKIVLGASGRGMVLRSGKVIEKATGKISRAEKARQGESAPKEMSSVAAERKEKYKSPSQVGTAHQEITEGVSSSASKSSYSLRPRKGTSSKKVDSAESSDFKAEKLGGAEVNKKASKKNLQKSDKAGNKSSVETGKNPVRMTRRSSRSK